MILNIQPTRKRVACGNGEAMLFTGQTEMGIHVSCGVMLLSVFCHPLRRSCWGGLGQYIRAPFTLMLSHISIEHAGVECTLWRGQSACGKRVIAGLGFIFPVSNDDHDALQEALRPPGSAKKSPVKHVYESLLEPIGHEKTMGFVDLHFPNAGRG